MCIRDRLCTQPEMLILDEPESNLDFKNQLVILDIVKQLSRERGIAAIINTHCLLYTSLERHVDPFPDHRLLIQQTSP